MICGPLVLRVAALMTARTRSPGLFLAGQHRLDPADLDDDVAVLEPLHRAREDFTHPIVVLGEDVLTLGLAHLLEDHLLGGLRGDAPESFGRPGELHLVADFDARRHLLAVRLGIGRAGLVNRNLDGRVLDGLDDRPDRHQVHVARLAVEARLEVLAALEHLARRRKDRVLDGRDDDLRVDTPLLREGFNRLLDGIAAACHA
jgi:hypothetical protein